MQIRDQKNPVDKHNHKVSTSRRISIAERKGKQERRGGQVVKQRVLDENKGMQPSQSYSLL